MTIQRLEREIEEAKVQVTKALNLMTATGINYEKIKKYNDKLVILSDLQAKYKHLTKKRVTRIYMNELKIIGRLPD